MNWCFVHIGAALLAMGSGPATAQHCLVRFEQPTKHDGADRLFRVTEGGIPALYGTRLYGSEPTEAMFFAQWTGGEWTSPGALPGLHVRRPGQLSRISDLCVYDDGSGEALYACGFFEENDLGEPLRAIAKWNGEKWVDVGGGIDGVAYSMSVFDDGVLGPALFVGGRFSEAGGRPVSSIARWDGDVWSDVGGGVSGGQRHVEDTVVFDDGSGPALFVGGSFTHCSPGQESKGIAKWTGHEWVPIGARVQGPWTGPTEINQMVVHDDGTGVQLYAVGTMGSIAGLRAQGIARWDGHSWSNVGDTAGAVAQVVKTLAVFDDGAGPKLYVGNAPKDWFSSKVGVGLARWDGVRWEQVLNGSDRMWVEHRMASLTTPHGEELWISDWDFGLGRLRCTSEACDIADCDRNGRLDFFDFLCYQNLFATADPAADCDGDGELTVFDFLCFQNAFAAGCP